VVLSVATNWMCCRISGVVDLPPRGKFPPRRVGAQRAEPVSCWARMPLMQSTDAARAWLTYREYERVRVLGRGQHGSAVLLRHAVTGECVVSKEVLTDGMDVEVRILHASPDVARHATPRFA